VFRSPIEVCHHYQKGIPKHKYVTRYRARVKAVKAWFVYNSCLLEFINQAKQPSIVIEYSEFMNKKNSVEELSKFIGTTLTDTRNMSLYRAKTSADMSYKLFNFIAKLNKTYDADNLFNTLKEKKYSHP
jgi:hypothetical protein